MHCFLKMAEILLKRKWMVDIQVNTYNGFAKELGAHSGPLRAGDGHPCALYIVLPQGQVSLL